MNIGDVVQFNENHCWRGCLGIINEKKEIHNEDLKIEGKNDIRYMVGVPIPKQGTAYIYVLESESVIEEIGQAILVSKRNDDDE